MIAHSYFKLNEDLIYLAEALKVEGYWSSKSFSLALQNKDIPFLNHIEKIVENLSIKISKRILLKIKLKDNTKKEDVELYWNEKKLNFHIEKNPFDNNKVKAVTSLPFKKEYQISLKCKNKKSLIKIKCLKEKIIIEGDIKCWAYKDLRFPTRRLLDFLDEYCGGNKNLEVKKSLWNADNKFVMSAFSSLVDCEGTLDYYRFKRGLRIRMNNKNYLKGWEKLLRKHEIYSKFRKNKESEFEINIYGWEDFDRLERLGFRLYHSKKSEKWKNIMNSFKRKQISRDSYKKFYIDNLREINKKITAKDFASYLNKSKRVISHYLLKLEKQKLISCNRNVWPYLYFIST